MDSTQTTQQPGSKRFSLSLADVRRWSGLIGKIAIAGFLSCVSLWITGIDGGFWGPLLTVIASSLLDLSHRFISDTRPPEPPAPPVVTPPWMYPPPNSNYTASGDERATIPVEFLKPSSN